MPQFSAYAYKKMMTKQSLHIADVNLFLYEAEVLACMHLKITPRVFAWWVASFAAMPMSFTYWARWSFFVTGSKYSHINLEKADNDLLTPCASLLRANVRLPRLNASFSTDLWSIIWRQWYAWEHSNLQKSFLPAIFSAASVRVLTWRLLLI